ncbi:MAG: FecR domain-containing protein [Candidatus Tectimicrobiota bacterium]
MPYWQKGVCATALAVALLLGPQTAAAEAIGQIKTLAGEVYIVRESMKRPAQAGDLLEAADTLMTGPAGRAGVTFIDNSRFSVGPNSQIALEKFIFNPTTQEGAFHTKMERGTLAVVSGNIAHSSPEAMQVKTRTSILGVRGTHFLVKVDE